MKYVPVFLEKSGVLKAKGVSDLLLKTGRSRPLFHDLGDDDEENEEITIASNQFGKSKHRQHDKITWTIAEDKALCSAYTEAGGDAVKLTNQKRSEFWACIIRMFDDAQKENPLTINQRSEESCRARWRRINLIVNKWVEVYKEAQRKRNCDSNEDNVLGEARKIWEKANNGHKFLLEHCWDILKRYPKWQGGMTIEDQGSGHNSKRNSDTPTTQHVEVCPSSVKRSRNKGKPNISSQDDIDSVTNFIDRQNTNNCEIDAKRFQLEKQMFEFWKEKERKRQAKRDERRRFKLYYTLMGKSILSLDEAQLYARLHEEYKDI